MRTIKIVGELLLKKYDGCIISYCITQNLLIFFLERQYKRRYSYTYEHSSL
jgi:hypothetical protein